MHGGVLVYSYLAIAIANHTWFPSVHSAMKLTYEFDLSFF